MVARRPTRRDRDSGAAAVEFALVVPLLLMLLFGMIDYGMFFSNQIAVKQGVRDATRQGVVGNFGSVSSCGMTWSSAPNTQGKQLACTVRSRTEPLAGNVYVKIVIPSGGWEKGEAVTVCEMVQTEGLTGFVPMPDNGIVSTKVEMSIEQDNGPAPTSGEQAPPAGANWSWC